MAKGTPHRTLKTRIEFLTHKPVVIQFLYLYRIRGLAALNAAMTHFWLSVIKQAANQLQIAVAT